MMVQDQRVPDLSNAKAEREIVPTIGFATMASFLRRSLSQH